MKYPLGVKVNIAESLSLQPGFQPFEARSIYSLDFLLEYFKKL